jgi:hypothetical protein
VGDEAAGQAVLGQELSTAVVMFHVAVDACLGVGAGDQWGALAEKTRPPSLA